MHVIWYLTWVVFVLYEFQLLIVALAVIVAWIIPGHVLNKKFKKGISNGG